MLNENENSVREEPATHSKKAQLWMFILGGALILLLAVDIIRKSFSDDTTAEPAPVEKELNKSDNSGVVIQDRFDRKFDQENRRRKREQALLDSNKLNQKETIPDRIDRLKKEKANINGERTPLGQGSDKESAYEKWAVTERIRVLNSRKSGFDFKKSGVGGVNLGQIVNPSANVRGNRQGKISKQQALIARERARVANIKKQIESGANPSTVLSSSGLGLNNQSGFSGLLGQKTKAQSNPLVVGRPAYEQGNRVKPGQVLLPTATIIKAVLDQDVTSDYVGPYRALITHDVYDADYNRVLIPRGSKISGKTLRIKNVNEPIQARMGLTVNWVILPDGKRISFESSKALDRSGIAGLKDEVDYHFLAQFLGVTAYAVLSSETQRNNFGDSGVSAAGDLGTSLRNQFAPLAQRYLSLSPTVTLRQGEPMTIFVEDDIYVKPWDTRDSGLL